MHTALHVRQTSNYHLSLCLPTSLYRLLFVCRAEEGSWVRPRAGMYKSDLGQVVTVDYSKGVAEVRLVPRIDYAELAKRALEGRMPAFGGHRAGAARPKPKWVSFTWMLLATHSSACCSHMCSCFLIWQILCLAAACNT